MLSKNLLLNWYSSMKKDSNDFWHRKLTLKVKLRHFLTPPYYTNFQNSMISLGYVDFRQKSFQFCTPRLKTRQPVLPYFGCCCRRILTCAFRALLSCSPKEKKNAQYDLLSSKRVSRLPVLATRFLILIFVTFILMFPATASSLLSMD